MTNSEGKHFNLLDSEYSSREMVLITLSMLESQGYHTFVELMSLLNDPELIIKTVRFLYGMDIKVPSLKTFITTLRAAIYTFCDMHKKIHTNLPVKPRDIRTFLNITNDEEKELLDIFDKWAKFMHDQHCDVDKLMHINRKNTKKRIKMAANGKKWTQKIY